MKILGPTRISRLNEVAAFVFLFAAVAFTLSLVSYRPTDPSWNASTWRTPPHNRIGRAGSHLSDLSFQLFGLGAWLLPLLAGMLGWCWLRSRDLSSPLTRVLGYTSMASSVSGLLALLRVPNPHDGAFSAGGSLGFLVASSLSASLNTAGAALTLLVSRLHASRVYLVSAFSSCEARAVLCRGLDRTPSQSVSARALAALPRPKRRKHRIEKARLEAAPPPPAKPPRSSESTRAAAREGSGYVLSPAGLDGRQPLPWRHR